MLYLDCEVGVEEQTREQRQSLRRDLLVLFRRRQRRQTLEDVDVEKIILNRLYAL